MIGKNIRYYRLMRHMSQEELAHSIGLNKMAISNYEMEKRTPDLATLRKIADAFHVSISRLTASCGEELTIQHGAFRKHSNISQKLQEVILGSIDRYLDRLFQVVFLLGDMVLAPAPKIERIPAGNPESAGQALRRVLGLPANGPVGNITDILENQGYIICPIQLEDRSFSGNSGMVNGRPYIAVNTTMPAERQRFTLIHELVHLVFSLESDVQERIVDSITGAFLLPESDIMRELGPKRSDIRSDLRYIQGEYKISVFSAAVRAHQTGIISQDVYTKTAKWISSQGLRLDERSGIEPEQSRLLEQMTVRAVSEGEITLSKAAELLERPIFEVRSLCYGGV